MATDALTRARDHRWQQHARPQRRKPWQRKSNWLAFAFLAPNVSGLAIFYLWPIVQNLYYSFTEWQVFGQHSFSGVVNYLRLLDDSAVIRSFGNTFAYTVLTVPISIAIALVLATLLNRQGRSFQIYRVVLLLPMVTMPAAVGMIWRWIYNGEYGILNALLSALSVPPVSWLSGQTALFSLVVVGVWSALGYNLIILLAGLQTIDKTFYEAATLDGAGPVRQLLSITLPMLTPTLFFLSITSLITALQVFDLIFLMFDEASLGLDATQSAVYSFYQQSFVVGDKGYGATVAVAIFLIILAITVLQVRLQKKWVFYG